MTQIATFNVNGVNGRLPVLLKWLGETSYDVVCLQEIKISDDKFATEAIREAGYGAIWHGQKSYNGVATLARGRDPVERRRCPTWIRPPSAETSRADTKAHLGGL